MAKWYTAALSSADPTVAEVAIYDDIGFFGISPMDFLKEIDGLGPVSKINLLIDSNGGSVDAGLAMFNILKRHPASVTAKIDAAACSAATLVAMAADEIQMPENTAMFIHNPMAMMFGFYNSADLRDEANVTDKWRDLMIRTYQAKTSITPEDMGKLLDESTWLTAEEAVKLGLADKVLPVSKTPTHVNVAGLPGKVPVALKLRTVATAGNPTRQSPQNAAEKWTVGASKSLPTSKKDSWDGGAASKAMLDDASDSDGTLDQAAAKEGFLVHDANGADKRGGYKLPIADMVDGKKTVTRGAIRAAAQRLPDTDIPDDVKTEAQGVIDHYKSVLGMDGNDDDGDTLQSKRVTEIASLCKIAGFSELAPDLILGDKTVEQVRDLLVEKRAEKDEKTGTLLNIQGGGSGPNAIDRAAAANSWVKAHEIGKTRYSY